MNHQSLFSLYLANIFCSQISDGPDLKSLLRWYPGSPALSAFALPGSQHRLHLFEARKAECGLLRAHMLYLQRTAQLAGQTWAGSAEIRCADGLAGVSEWLRTWNNTDGNDFPPADSSVCGQTKRAIVFLDPAYEQGPPGQLFTDLVAQLAQIPQATTLMWYPATAHVTGSSGVSRNAAPSPVLLQASGPNHLHLEVHAGKSSPAFGIHVLHAGPTLKSALKRALPHLNAFLGVDVRVRGL